MQLVTGLFSAIGSGASAIASGVGSAFSALTGAGAASGTVGGVANAVGAGTAGGGLSFASLLQGGLGVMEAMGAMRQGQAEAAAYRSQAADTRLDITQESIDATERQTSLRKQLVSAIGERDTAYAASGVDMSFGTPQQARNEAIAAANDAITSDQSSSDIRKNQMRVRAQGYDMMANDAQQAGIIKGIGSIFDAGISIFGRGQ